MTAPESDADLLRRAANLLEHLCPIGDSWYAKETEGGVREILTDPVEGAEYAATVATVPPGVWNIDNAAWIAATGVQLRAPLIAWLRAEADCTEHAPDTLSALGRLGGAVQEHTTGEPAEPWAVKVTLSTTEQAVTVARAILGEAGETP